MEFFICRHLGVEFNPVRLGGICFLFTFAVVVFISAKYTGFRERKVHLRGTKLLTPKQFEHEVEGDGIAFPNNGIEGGPNFLRINAEDESKHVLICGDTGSGKSALFHYMLSQIAMRRTDLVVIYDPKLEYWRTHGRPDRGDTLLYPFSDSCPYWDLAAELSRPEMAELVAESLLPCEPGKDEEFFTDSARNVLTQVLRQLRHRGGTIEQLLDWMSNSNIDKFVDQQTRENIIPVESPNQRNGVLGKLSSCSAHLKKLPASANGRSPFSFYNWSQKRPGWLFIGAMGVTDQELLQPVFSIWLNILLQQLLDTVEVNPPATWIMIDEIASLKTLSCLEMAASQARGYNTRLALGFQNKHQIEHFYSGLAQPILAAPKTKIFLRTAEIDSAEWCARSIGEPEFQQRVLSESSQLSLDRRHSISYRSERKTEYLVLPAEFLSLKDRQGYLQYQGAVTPIEFSYPNITSVNTVKRGTFSIAESMQTSLLSDEYLNT